MTDKKTDKQGKRQKYRQKVGNISTTFKMKPVEVMPKNGYTLE